MHARQQEKRLAELEQEVAALRVEAEQRSLILESATDYAIFTIDRAGVVTSWNTGAERLLYALCLGTRAQSQRQDRLVDRGQAAA